MHFITQFLMALLTSISVVGQAAHPAVIKEEFVFTDAPTVSCHASTITQTSTGSLLCSWFGGTDEGEKDVGIWLSSYNGSHWSTPRKAAQADGVPCWNPVLFTLPSDEILLFYKAGKTPRDWSGFLKRSFDGGITWTKEECLPAGVIGPVKNKPLLLQDGTLLCGSACESYQRWGCWIDITSDGGQTWSKSTPINVPNQPFGIIQPALFFSQKGEIRLLTRSYQVGYVCTAVSHDEGKTWSSAVPTSLPNPNAAIDAHRLKDGRILVVYNHSSDERTPLNVAISEDGGKTWIPRVILEDAPGEYSYPSIIQANDGYVHIVYTWKRELVKHVVIDPKSL